MDCIDIYLRCDFYKKKSRPLKISILATLTFVTDTILVFATYAETEILLLGFLFSYDGIIETEALKFLLLNSLYECKNA